MEYKSYQGSGLESATAMVPKMHWCSFSGERLLTHALGTGSLSKPLASTETAGSRTDAFTLSLQWFLICTVNNTVFKTAGL